MSINLSNHLIKAAKVSGQVALSFSLLLATNFTLPAAELAPLGNESVTTKVTTKPVRDIIDQANLASYYAGDDGRAEARMIIVDENGNRQMRQFTILRKDEKDLGDQDMLVFFSQPSNVKDTVFRVEKQLESDDNRWLFLPALDLVKRISAGDKRTSFVGSHFYYEDVSGRNPKEDNFTLVSEDKDSYLINAVAKDRQSVEFSRYTVKIDKANFLPIETIYFDQSNQAVRKMTVLQVKNIDGIATVMKSRIINLSNNSYTEMQFRHVKYNLGLPDNIFSERSMRTPPKAWLE
ncbi:outer membrane lipoprotein-sorting protein [Colwellia sp. MB02u-6]|uniref:outer membrane lipoprotein-sorting protein n=1 Tax=Colwellia sp. MB02u-6 TaxID=2759824 RepID=UPI0015F71A07|nr:outer membrane lipoprotein-sorting protein [Colwellia sp. MB02u-6]MBA6329033.1 outer membrane lipoprotein-sorting protein [Colwellia sp. MB02u-6]